MLLHEAISDGVSARICADGSLVADVRAARIGIQEYLGREVDPDNQLGLRDKAVVRVYRPENEVFSRDSMASYAAAPVTIDHPSQAVTADNWRRLGVGEIHGDVVRDGGFVRVPIIVRDAAAVEKVRTTHKQLSMGYSCTLDATPGTSPDGQAYDAVQRNIRINHIAAVPAARGGPELKISDERTPPLKEKPVMAGTIIVDGLPVSLADEAAVRAVIEKKDAAIAAADKALADAKTTISTLTGEKAALDKALADEKAKTTPAALAKLIADRAALIDMAKKMAPDESYDDEDEMGVKRKAMKKKMGDALNGMNDAEISGAFAAFAALAKDAKPADNRVVALPLPTHTADAASIRDAALRNRYAR